MPIIWKSSFEAPIINLIKSGAISNSRQLVDAIALHYDLCIKQGIAGPGAVAAKLVAGNILVFKRNLLNFYFVTSAKQKIALYAVYIASINSLLSQLSALKKEITSINKQIKEYEESAKQLVDSEIKSKISKAKLEKKVLEEQIQFIRNNNIQELKKTYGESIKRIAAPMLQNSRIQGIKQKIEYVSQEYTELNNKKREYLGEISRIKRNITDSVSSIQDIAGSLKDADKKTVLNSAVSLLATSNVNSSIQHANEIVKIVDSYPIRDLPKNINEYKSNLSTIIKSKIEILNKKEEIKQEVIRFAESKKQFRESIKILNKVSRIQELRSDVKNIKETALQAKEISSQLIATKDLYRLLKSEKNRIKPLIQKGIDKYVPNSSVVNKLRVIAPDAANMYKNIQTSKDAEKFIINQILVYATSLTALIALRESYKQFVPELKNTIKSKLKNDYELIFNNFLRAAIIGYWTGGVIVGGGTGNVINPGTIVLPTKMESTANYENFIVSLSKTFQTHLPTLSGTFVIPGSPPVTVPWIGYS
jgi:hypothetical protein